MCGGCLTPGWMLSHAERLWPLGEAWRVDGVKKAMTNERRLFHRRAPFNEHRIRAIAHVSTWLVEQLLAAPMILIRALT